MGLQVFHDGPGLPAVREAGFANVVQILEVFLRPCGNRDRYQGKVSVGTAAKPDEAAATRKSAPCCCVLPPSTKARWTQPVSIMKSNCGHRASKGAASRESRKKTGRRSVTLLHFRAMQPSALATIRAAVKVAVPFRSLKCKMPPSGNEWRKEIFTPSRKCRRSIRRPFSLR